jgi:hypothetical protein
MKKIDKKLKQLSDLYEFNRRLKKYRLKSKETANKQSEKDTPERHVPRS